MPLPSGTVTFLFTDIESSTRLWETYPVAMRTALARHDALIEAASMRCNGSVFKTVGDAFCVVFDAPDAALQCALEIQQALLSEAWGEIGALRVRVALHTGDAEVRGGDYFGPTLNRVARLLMAGHGGQILLSAATRLRVAAALPQEAALLDLGNHRLKDLQLPEQVYQLLHPDLPADFPPLRSLQAFSHNLPVQLTSFVGREHDLAEVRRMLSQARLLTLAGPGGVGKTRLALQAAAEALEQYPDGVWMAELAALTDAALVPQAVVQALGIREEPGRTLEQTLVEYLLPKRLLLLLDNCEHLLTACVRLADTLIRACPELVVLVTSREALGVAGEQVFRVPTLGLPEERETPSAEMLENHEAVRLFCERARSYQPAFLVTTANASALVQVCRHLDGIPLAIELAAARMRAMPVEQLASRLDDRFRLLTGGSRAALPRQQTLRALIDWSYSILSPQEQTLLGRLSVFAGGWTLDAAEAVCSDSEEGGRKKEEARLILSVPPFHLSPFDVLDLLTSLVDKSLVIYDELQQRYRMLETVRQYSRDRLRESETEESVLQQHRDWYFAMAEQALAGMHGPEQHAGIKRLTEENDNIRAALDFQATQSDSERELNLIAGMSRYWEISGSYREANQRLIGALERGETSVTEARARALLSAGANSWRCGDYQAARAYYEASRDMAQAMGNAAGVSGAIMGLANVTWYQGDHEAAEPLYEACLALARQAGDPKATSIALNNLALVAQEKNDLKSARAYYEEALAIRRKLGNRLGLATLLNNLGAVILEEGDFEAAWKANGEALAIHHEFNDRMGLSYGLQFKGVLLKHKQDWAAARICFQESLQFKKEIEEAFGIYALLHDIADLDARLQYGERAALLWGAAERLREQIGAGAVTQPRPEEYAELRDATHRALGAERFERLKEEGKLLTTEQAIAFALETPPSQEP